MADWLIEPRGPDLRRQRPLRYWSKLTVNDRYLRVGSWAVEGPAKYLRPLYAAGMGVVLSRSGTQIMSGLVTQYGEDGSGNGTLIGWDDKVWLGGGPDDLAGRIVYPDHTRPITGQEQSTVTLTGPRETLVVQLIDRHAGPGALTDRRTPTLTLPASLGRGGTATVTAQLDLLHVLVGQLAETAALDVRVVHDEAAGAPRLLVVITPVQDVSARVRFGPASGGGPGVLGSDWQYTVYAPTATDAVVGGTKPLPANFTDDDTADVADDSGVDLRQYRLVRDTTTGTAAWQRRAEKFVDSSATNGAAELDQAGADALAETLERREFSGTLTDNNIVQYGRDWLIGYKVGVTPSPGVEFADVVREVVTTVQQQQGQQTEQVQAAVGWQRATVAGTTTQTAQQVREGFRRAYKIAVWG